MGKTTGSTGATERRKYKIIALLDLPPCRPVLPLVFLSVHTIEIRSISRKKAEIWMGFPILFFFLPNSAICPPDRRLKEGELRPASCDMCYSRPDMSSGWVDFRLIFFSQRFHSDNGNAERQSV